VASQGVGVRSKQGCHFPTDIGVEKRLRDQGTSRPSSLQATAVRG
jgi:hypothetical protein